MKFLLSLIFIGLAFGRLEFSRFNTEPEQSAGLKAVPEQFFK